MGNDAEAGFASKVRGGDGVDFAVVQGACQIDGAFVGDDVCREALFVAVLQERGRIVAVGNDAHAHSLERFEVLVGESRFVRPHVDGLEGFAQRRVGKPHGFKAFRRLVDHGKDVDLAGFERIERGFPSGVVDELVLPVRVQGDSSEIIDVEAFAGAVLALRHVRAVFVAGDAHDALSSLVGVVFGESFGRGEDQEGERRQNANKQRFESVAGDRPLSPGGNAVPCSHGAPFPTTWLISMLLFLIVLHDPAFGSPC
nr:hypothetical protein [Paraeggerthella hongkongensis]